MEVVNKIDYLNAILKNKSLELQFDQIELDDKEIIDEDTHDYRQDYLTFEALEEGAFSFTENIKYSYNDSEWIQLNAGTNTCNINKGDIIRIKNDDAEYISCSITKSLKFLAYGSFDKSRIKCAHFFEDSKIVNAKNIILGRKLNYNSMFSGCISLVNAPELPATALYKSCYYMMFYGCTSLVNAPELPATKLSNNCYSGMFYGCTSLVNAPKLPATKLYESCYSSMFSRCTSLVNAPELPATKLSESCYSSMFSHCTSLVNAPELPATTLSAHCYNSMFSGCNSLVNAPKLSATILSNSCYNGMFYGCTSLVNAPELPATTLYNSCYNDMFYGCVNLNYIKAMFITTQCNCTDDWVGGVAPHGTFVKLAGIQFEEDIIPKSWTVQEIDPDTGEIVNEYINKIVQFHFVH